MSVESFLVLQNAALTDSVLSFYVLELLSRVCPPLPCALPFHDQAQSKQSAAMPSNDFVAALTPQYFMALIESLTKSSGQSSGVNTSILRLVVGCSSYHRSLVHNYILEHVQASKDDDQILQAVVQILPVLSISLWAAHEAQDFCVYWRELIQALGRGSCWTGLLASLPLREEQPLHMDACQLATALSRTLPHLSAESDRDLLALQRWLIDQELPLTPALASLSYALIFLRSSQDPTAQAVDASKAFIFKAISTISQQSKPSTHLSAALRTFIPS